MNKNYSSIEDGHGSTPLLQTDNSTGPGFKESCTKITPLLMVSGAGLIFSIQAVLSKLMPIPPEQYVITEATFNIPLCLMICFHSGVDVSPLSIRENRMYMMQCTRNRMYETNCIPR